ncbi:DUF2207 domain-containing protein [Methanosarcina sp. UBA5]|uniref:DUF2207 domain-containing protein n=1 Tax=Methanosarcina sp. UBA5 TaxID=1915593 RepID=UPI0025CD2D31|nr:DUF2207 domain-containing protein [Methanosarcina sp. UBA5]
MRLSNSSVEPIMDVNIVFIALKVAILFLFVLCLVHSASARDYTLEGATSNITIDPSGIVHIEESISYTFEGHYNRVFRKLKVLPGESIQNIKGHCSDEACKFSVNPTSEGYELEGSLPSSTPEKVTFFISYDHYGAVKVHKDVSEFQYKLWGDEWEKPLGNLRGRISLPVNNESELQYWIHPTGYTQVVSVEHNVLNLRTAEIPSNQWYEIRVVFPRIASPNSSIVQIDNEEGLAQIKSIENEYQTKGSLLKNFYNFTILFVLLALAFPFLIYFKYGREPKINYDAIYEREPPTNSRPAVVNAIVLGKMGIPTMNGFTATIMDLVNLGYISLLTVKSEEKKVLGLFKSESEDILIEILDNNSFMGAKKDRRQLEDFEKDAFNLLRSHASGDKVFWNKLKEELGDGTAFYEFVTSWNEKVKAHTAFDKLFLSTGNKYVFGFGLATVIAGFLCFFVASEYFPTDEFPLASSLNMLIFLIIVLGIVIILISVIFKKVFGRWTPEGRLYYERWNNFKKYLTDFSALKEHPPESIKIWDCYLVYATALGIAQEVIHNMSLIVPSEVQEGSSFYPVSSSYVLFDSGFGSAYASSSPSGSGDGGVGGIGGIGGGSGGGGGGAD